VRIARGLSEAAFAAEPWCYTVINSNSPRQLDRPMAEGLIDFAEAGQLSVVTPFCLMGAMAPVSLAGAMVLSHAEALAMIALAQLARPGAPVLYGSFTSNVDMRSGAPAFGTPEHVKASIATGQLARRVGLPWRGGAGTSANVNDAQAAQETLMSVWGLMLGGCTLIIHSAGWLEGGLTFGYEKLVTDLEALRTLAELCRPTPAGDDDLALDALAEVAPGGHFFAAAHTMAHYETAFFEPIAADRSNWGAFVERGSRDADARATAIWRRMLETAEAPPLDPARIEALDAFSARRSEEGGAPPLS
jgi:trimethylamine--corrinoid protein Co-methyltransferase